MEVLVITQSTFEHVNLEVQDILPCNSYMDSFYMPYLFCLFNITRQMSYIYVLALIHASLGK